MNEVIEISVLTTPSFVVEVSGNQVNLVDISVDVLPAFIEVVTNNLIDITEGNRFSLITATAAENISGGKAVSIHNDGLAYVYNISDDNDYLRVFGIAKQGVLQGQLLDIYISGEVIEVGSGWVFGKEYYVSSTGVLSQSLPVVGIIKRAGIGMSTDKIFLFNNTTDIITI